MNLRNLLRRATELRVAQPGKRNAQLSVGDCATDDATAAQQNPANPHEIRVSRATGIATTAQQGTETRATFANEDEELRVACTRLCNTQQGSLTAHRLEKALLESAMRRCEQFNDNEQARADMRRECLELPPHLQADLLAHFQGKQIHFN